MYYWDEDQAIAVNTANDVTPAGSGPGDLAVLNNTLYVLSYANADLHQVDPWDGSGQRLCDLRRLGQTWGMAGFGSVLYVGAGTAGTIYTIDPTNCNSTTVGATGFSDLRGLAFADGVLYGVRTANGWPIYRIDTGDGTATLVADLGHQRVLRMAWPPTDTGCMYPGGVPHRHCTLYLSVI